MYIARILLNGRYLKNGVACSVGRRITAFQTHSYCSSADSKMSSISQSAGSGLIQKKALILRVYRDNKGQLELTQAGQTLDKKTKGKLSRYIKLLDRDFAVGDAFVVTDVDTYEAVALSCCGRKDAGVNEVECLDENKENLRRCMAAADKALKLLEKNLTINCEMPLPHYELRPAQEGHYLYRWRPENEFTPIQGLVGYIDGVQNANAQNWARYLSQMPANKMTPEAIVQEAKKQLCPFNVKVKGYDKKDIEAKNMHAFLAVAQGSSEPPKLLECEFVGKADAPLVLIVAKGVTFDSGGLCLKKPENLLKRDCMTGAAAALGTILSLALLKAPVHVKLVVPLCENMISGQCLKVGDVVPTLKGIDVKVEDTDLEGHLMLADALTYGQTQFKPKYIMNVAALTPGIAMATGGVCYGCFTHNDDLWNIARKAGIDTGDRPWRFPIWDSYGKLITGDTPIYKLKNRGSEMASHCTGAAFLDKFITGDNWLHYDITGVGKMTPGAAPIYLNTNYMTGRPTRALIETIFELSKKKHDDDDTSPMMKATPDGNHEKKL